MKLQRRY